MSGINHIIATGWSDFRMSLLRYARHSRMRRNELWFRGQGDARWALSTTLDRYKKFVSVDDRESTNRALLGEFRQEALHLGTTELAITGENRLELLARHHGLPSPLMDWSLSPYVAAYFAYAAQHSDTEPVSVWCMDLAQVNWSARPDIEILRDGLPLFENRRALQQRGVFIRVSRPASLETMIPAALTRFDLPASDRDVALQDLDEMLVNATTMFYDLEGAAKTAVLRLSGS